MKKILSLGLLIFIFQFAEAKNYYFSSSNGDDSRSAEQAQNSSTPWKSLDKLNASFYLILPGDNIYLKSGDIFYGNLNVTASGTTNMPIVISSYGSGPKPIITGLTTMTNWMSIGNGIYESYNSGLGNIINMVVINGVVTPMGRYPNKGYFTFQSHNGNSSITDNNLSSSTDWTGAELVVRTRHWIIDRTKIGWQSGSTIGYNTQLSYEPMDNFGYFIQNDIRTLDQLGEWYYNAGAKKLDVYFGSANPASYDVKASFINTLVTIYNRDNIVFNNLVFKGSNVNTFDISASSNTQITNCDILYAGTDAITGAATTNMKIENNNIINSNNNALSFAYDCNYASFRNNNIRNTTTFAGMCTSGNTTGLGIFIRGNNNLIEYNNIDSSGFTPIRFADDYNVIKNNYITNFNFVKDDEGAIYTVNNNYNAGQNSGRKIIGNIILNGIGANEGADNNLSADGIYIDDNSSGVEIDGNTISNCNNNGIYIHDSHEINIHNNTSFNNNNSQVILKYDNIAPQGVVRNIQNNNNIYFAKPATQMVARFQSIANDFSLMGYYDNNYYCRPLNDALSLLTRDVNGFETALDLNTWKAIYGQDASSKTSPVQISPYALQSVSTVNKVPNGDFNSGIGGLYVYSTASSYSSDWNSGGKLDGGAFQGHVNSNITSTYSPIIAVGNISSSKQYLIRFSAISSDDAVFNLYLRRSTYPYQAISEVKSFHITPNRKEYEFLFSYPASESDASIGFETASQSLYFWLDNIKLLEANASVTNPDDSIRFEYNPTAYARSVSLDKNYIDVKNNKYSGTITLQPYSSLILLKDNSVPVITLPSPTIKIVNPLGNAIFDASSNILVTTLSLAGTDGGYITKVDFYSGGVWVGSSNSAPFNFTLKNYPVGNYSITARATDNNGTTGMSAPVVISVRSIIISPGSIATQSDIMDGTSTKIVDVKLGPNPATNRITVYTQGFINNQPMGITIYSMDGMEVKNVHSNTSTTNNLIDISSLSAGVYILKVQSGTTTINKQFIKSKL